MGKPGVTVVVASYNHARFVEQAIESLLGQTEPPVSLVVIDDGSRDGSKELLRKLAVRRRFLFVEQSNIGLAQLLNRALCEFVHSEYVVFFASDDVAEPDRLERQRLFLDAHPEVAMVYGDVWKVNEAGKRVGRMYATPASGRVFERALAGQLCVPPQSTMWRCKALREVGGVTPGVRSEDICLLWKVTKRFAVASLPGVFASYRLHANQQSRDARVMVAEAQRQLEEYAGEACYGAAKRSQARFWFFSLASVDRREAMRHFWDAMRHPLDPLFLGGVANLLGLGALRQPYRFLRSWIVRR